MNEILENAKSTGIQMSTPDGIAYLIEEGSDMYITEKGTIYHESGEKNYESFEEMMEDIYPKI